MESPLMTPSFVVPAILTLVSVIIWLVRLESKANAAREGLAEFEKEAIQDIADHKASLDTLRERFFQHVTNVNLHHNEQAVMEFRSALEHRFNSLESGLSDIKAELKRMSPK